MLHTQLKNNLNAISLQYSSMNRIIAYLATPTALYNAINALSLQQSFMSKAIAYSVRSSALSMKPLFQVYSKNQCCLCGSKSKLTREHKIKASSIRELFGKTEFCIVKNQTYQNSRNPKPRCTESDKSTFLKFKTARLCEICNTNLTQPADIEFDIFNKLIKKCRPSEVFKLPKYKEGVECYLNIFRYFAKLLCCHLSDFEAPVPKSLSSFSIGKHNTNRVCLEIQNDPIYEQINEQYKESRYAAHGGLIVFGDKITYTPKSFYSSVSIKSIKYTFCIELNTNEQQELKSNYADFFELCKSKVEKECKKIESSK